jgi:hypothetical protein
MNRSDLSEAIAVATAILSALQGTVTGLSGLAGAQLNFLCGALASNGPTELNAGGSQFWDDFAACFDAAPPAGVTFAAMEAVRLVVAGQTPAGIPAITVKNFAARMALAEQARILAATTFKSRSDVDGYFDQVVTSFDAAELVAADSLDNVSYRALIALHAAVSNDLANRSRPLPRMATYSFPARMPSLWMAQRVYCDPSRNDELIAENKPIHPLFMPSSGVALSS